MAALVDRHRLQELVADGAQLVEVLPEKEYREDHLPGAASLPLGRIDAEGPRALDRSRAIVVYCWDSA